MSVRSVDRRWMLLLVLALAGCAGGLHRRGQHELGVTGMYDHWIKGDNVWPDGKGTADNAGISLDYGYYATDRLALVGKLTPYRIYNQSDGDAYSGEFQLGVRYHFLEFEAGEVPIGLYAEVLGGLMNASHSVPEEGSHSNFTQDTGAGVEVQLADNVFWRTGYRLRHLSNGRIFRSDSNPSQNNHEVYTGLAISLE